MNEKLAVGDDVRILINNAGKSGYEKGHVGKVLEKDKNNCRVGPKTISNWARYIDLEKVEPPKVEKKKPYYVTVWDSSCTAIKGYKIVLFGHNDFYLVTPRQYNKKREANQMAKRLADNLGLEFRG